jgi:tetratricopeptide (TPR) repeat protein
LISRRRLFTFTRADGYLLLRVFVMLYRFLFVALLFSFIVFSASQSFAQDTIIVIPFENRSPDQRENNWIGESFADQLTDLLKVPGLGVITTKQRQVIYQKIRLPFNVIPSRATSLKIANEAKATLLVTGNYEIIPAQGDLPISIKGSAFVIKVNEGRRPGEKIPGEPWFTRNFDFGDAVANIQKIHAQLAYQVLEQQFKETLSDSFKEIEARAKKIPPLAFEAFIKGILTKDLETRINYFKNAMRLYSESNSGKDYPQAAYELGLCYMKQADWRNAAEFLTKLHKEDRNYVEAAFYASLAYWRLNDNKGALNVLLKLSDYCSLTSVYVNAGAMSVFAAREEKNPDEKTRLLEQAVKLLERASQTSPSDLSIRFNYGYALFVSGKYKEAIDQLRPVIEGNQSDGQAHFIMAKSLEKIGKTEEANTVDNEAKKKLGQRYAKFQVAWEKNQTTEEISLNLRQDLNQAAICDEPEPRNPDIAQALMEKAKQLFTAGNDEEALKTLRQVLIYEPTNPEVFYLIGSIHQRNGDQEAAISNLKTSIFWNNNWIGSHILLAKIYISKGECGLARSHARTAFQIDQNNQETIGLQRILEMGNCK